MSGTPPPNYNPNDSMLSGGDSAKIIPVQGGGFMPGGNYNADVSLLSGGEDAKILPVQGGGKPPTAAEQKAASIKLLEVGERLKRMQALEKEIEQLAKEPVGPELQAKLAKLREKLAAAPANAKAAAEASAAAITAQLSKNHKEYASLAEEIARLQAQPKSEERDAKLKELHRKFDRLPPLSTIEEANETPNENEEDELPALNNLDVYVLAEGEDLPSLDQLSLTVEEEAKKGKGEGEEEAKQLEVPCPAPDPEDVEDLAENFEQNDDAVDSKTKEVIRLVSREFYIRVPKRKSAGEKEDDDIMADWKAGVFTEEEADFLNTMGLSPKLLYSSFYCHDKDWLEELAEFLYYLGVYTCYPASSLVLRGECQRVREFLFIVESNLKADQLRKLAEKPVPVAGPITLPELEEDEEEEEEEGEEGEEGEESDENSKAHVEIGERLKKLNVDDVEKEKERKTVAAKIANFFKGFFKGKPAKKNAEDEILKELEKHNVNSNTAKPLLENEENNLDRNSQERKARLKSLEQQQLDEAFQEFLTRIPPEFRDMDPEILKKKYLSKGI
jgi:hypothetical protein